MKIVALSLATVLLLAACAPATPSADAVQTAIAQTLTAQPTATANSTPAPAPTSTLAPVPTGKPLLPGKVTPTPKGGPDLQVVDADPRRLVLGKRDLPTGAGYYLPAGSANGPVTNAEVVAARTVEEGQDYIERSRRIYGWEVELGRGASAFDTPDGLRNEVVLFQTAEGARSALDEEVDCAPLVDVTTGKPGVSLGDAAAVCTLEQNGQTTYALVFSYRNLLSVIEGWGSGKEIDPAFFEALAQKQLEIFQEQPLADTVTFTP